MRRKRIVNIILWVAGISLVGLFVYNQFIRTPPVFVDIQKEPVIEETLYREVSATGTINPLEMVEVGTQVSGEISEVRVDFNDLVKKGQVLARMDTRNLKATLEESKANLRKSEVVLDQSERNLKRVTELAEGGVVPQVDLEKAQDDYNNALATYHIAKLQLEKNSVNLGFANIVSPIDGVVISRNVEVGQTVAATFSTPTLFRIANDLKEMKIEASIDEADIGQIKQYQKAVFTVDSYPDEDFQGVVAQVQLQSTVIQNVVTYNAIILIENPDLKLLPGMTATLLIQTEERPNCRTVPNSALSFKVKKEDLSVLKKKKYKVRGLEKEAPHSVWIMKGRELKEVPVEVDFTNGIRTAIRGEFGLQDTVVTKLKVKTEEESGGNMFMPDSEEEED